MATLHLIYVPGLGDHRVTGQQKLIATWKLWGVSSELFQVGWADGEAWEPKYHRLLERIDAAIATGKTVGLVGASAGATAVINAYQSRRESMAGVVLIAGKINRPQAISQTLIRKNNAFGTAANSAALALLKLTDAERNRIQSRFALVDPVVPARDSRIAGADNRVLFMSMGHAFTIATQLLFGAPVFIHFLRKQAKALK